MIRNPHARALLQRIRGERPPPPDPRARHAKRFNLTSDSDRTAYETLYAMRLIGKITVLASKTKFSDDGRYYAFVKWEDTPPPPDELPPELQRIFTRERRTFHVRVFDAGTESAEIDKVMNNRDCTIFLEQGRFLSDGRYLLAIHWYESELLSGEAATNEATAIAAPQKKKKRRRRGRRRRRAAPAELAMTEASLDPLAGLPGPPP